MSRQSDYDAAYFALLRAREELAHLQRYADYLLEELHRLDDFGTAIDDAGEVVPAKFRRMVDGTAKPLLEAVDRRRAIIRSERRKLPDRIEAQEAYVRECEEEAAALR
jgi:hypothetical protein